MELTTCEALMLPQATFQQSGKGIDSSQELPSPPLGLNPGRIIAQFGFRRYEILDFIQIFESKSRRVPRFAGASSFISSA
jgi:hypothetical protein